jgi:hyperosmotically inducible periplasmic protein
VGYGTTTFNAIGVKVLNGVVTLGGNAYGPADKDSAISVASYTPGVQDVVDEIAIDPVSSMDDGIRIAVARAVYGHSSLNRYAINPARPIRARRVYGYQSTTSFQRCLGTRQVTKTRCRPVHI